MMWLAEVPIAVTRACVQMLPRLQAEESVLAVTRVSVGTGSIAASTSRDLLAQWSRTAMPPNTQRRPAPARPDQIRAMGIAYRVVPKVSRD